MTEKKLLSAKAEAERFLKMIDEYIESGEFKTVHEWYPPSKYRAAVKRSSMDLTRALVEMRKS
jgi:hypothetical protein